MDVSPARAVVAGALVGALAAGAVVATHDDEARREPAAEASAGERAATAAFVAAWRRSRMSTWALTERFERRLPDGRRLQADLRVVQRPPDRLEIGLGSVELRTARRRVACGVATSGQLRCREGRPPSPWQVSVERELATLRSQVTGRDPPYRVRAAQRCFRLTANRTVAIDGPWGDRALFCFDAATGASRSSTVWRDRVVDRRWAVEIRADVRDDDLALPDRLDGPVPEGRG